MASNELVYLLELIAEAVAWVLKRTWDLICTLLYLASLVAPWRLFEEAICSNRFDNDFHCYCIMSFFLTLLDLVVIPLGVFSIASPFRWYSILEAFTKYDDQDKGEFRLALAYSGFCAFLDFVSFLFGLVTIAMLVRSYVVLREAYLLIPQIMGATGTASFRTDREMELNYVFFISFWWSILDLLVLLFSLPLIIISPHFWGTCWNAVSHICGKQSTGLNSADSEYRIDAYNEVYDDLRLFFVIKIYHFFVDICAVFFAVMALISPIRNSIFRKECAEGGMHWCICQGAEQPGLPGEAPVERIVSSPSDIDFQYNFKARKSSFYHGSLAIVDFFLFPMLIPLFITWYRFKPVKEKLVSGEPWGLNQISIVVFQTALLTLDLLFSPVLAILFLTRIRFQPVADKYAVDDMCSSKSFDTYKRIWFAFFVLLLDIVVFPLALLILLTWYRSAPLRGIFKEPLVWNGFPNRVFLFHLACITQLILIFHDALLAVVYVFMMCTVYRSRYLIRLHPICSSIESHQTPAALTHTADIVNDQTAAPTADAVNDTQSGPLTEVQLVALDEKLIDMMAEGLEWRCNVWYEFLMLICDLPFILMAIFLFATLWRGFVLYKLILAQREKYRDKVISVTGPVNREEENYRNKYYSGLRKAVFSQLLLLFLDLLHLIPFFLVVVTVYRLPGLIIQLLAKFRQSTALKQKVSRSNSPYNPLLNEPADGVTPILQCNSVLMEFPDRGGPRVIIRASRTKSDDMREDFPRVPLKFASPRVKMHVVGNGLWTKVNAYFGSTVLAIGKSLLPLEFIDNESINLSAITSQYEVGVEECLGEIEFWIQFDFKNVKRTTIQKNLRNLNASDTPILLQFEAEVDSRTGSGKENAVLFSIVPTVKELCSVAEAGSASLPPSALDIDGLRKLKIYDELAMNQNDEESVVDSFAPTVLLSFSQLCLDFCYLMLFLAVCLVPWRLVKLLKTLFHSEEYRNFDIATRVMTLKAEGDRKLREYRMGLVPVLNELSKQPQSFYNTSWNYLPPSVERLEMLTLLRYSELYAQAFRYLKKNEGRSGGIGLDALAVSIPELVSVHQNRLMIWGFRSAVHMHLSAKSLTQNAHDGSIEISSIYDKKYFNKQLKIEKRINTEYDAMKERVLTLNERWSVKFLFKRPLDESRSIILDSFRDAVIDVAVCVLLIILVVTLSELPSFLSDLKAHWSSDAHTVKELIITHLKKSADQKKRLFTFLGLSTVVLVLVVGVPAFLEKLPRCSNLDEAIELAKETIKKSIWYLYSLLSLFTVWRTYRLTVTAAIYALFVPGACIAEGIPCCVSLRKPKFFFALIIWFLLLGLAIATTIVSENSNQVQQIRTMVIILLSIVSGIILFTSWSVKQKIKSSSPASDSKHLGFFKPLTPSWSNILSLITAPMETIQLCAVVIFYFWVTPSQFDDSSFVHHHASRLLLWGSASGDAEKAIKISVILAVCIVLGWVILSSLPLAYGGSENERRLKIIKMQSSASFNFCALFVSQLFYVWLSATMLRPSSCMESVSTDGPTLATAAGETLSCGYGGDASWSFRLSLPLLLYLSFTSSMMHSTSETLESRVTRNETPRDHDDDEPPDLVEYDQFYSHFLQIMQLGVLVTCATGFASANKAVPLIIIAALCALMAVIPTLCLSYSCSLSPVVGLRAVGALVSCWTAIACALRTGSHDNSWSDSSPLFIGWLVIFVIGIAGVIALERYRHFKWLAALETTGLGDSIESLMGIASHITVEEACIDSRLGQFSIADRKERLLSKVKAANSFRRLCQMIIELEYSILSERLDNAFIQNRNAWIRELRSWRFSGSDSVHSLKRLISDLKNGIKGSSAMTLLSRSVVSLTFRRKCPLEIAWVIFSYLYDGSKLRLTIDSMLQSSEIHYNVASKLTYRNQYTAQTMVRMSYEKISVQKSKMNEIVKNDDSLFGRVQGSTVKNDVSLFGRVQGSTINRTRARSADGISHESSVRMNADVPTPRNSIPDVSSSVDWNYDNVDQVEMDRIYAQALMDEDEGMP